MFFDQHPDIVLAPAYNLYEIFNLNYASYYYNGMQTAQWSVNNLIKYKNLNDWRILDWGYGPGRIIWHLPMDVDKSKCLFGTDYNKYYVHWCSNNIPNVDFQQNLLTPPLDYRENYFDVILGISMFTHLSEPFHLLWFGELMRVLKQGGILFLKLHGERFASK